MSKEQDQVPTTAQPPPPPLQSEASSSTYGGGTTGGFHPFKPVLQSEDTFANVETNLARPLTDAIVTVRVIKSFAYRSMKALVLKGVDLTTVTVEQLEDQCRTEVGSAPAFKAFRTYAGKLDTLKIYTRAHGAKTTNLIINLDHDDWVLDGDKRKRTLAELGLENEAELSLFHRADYDEFLRDPTTKW